MQGSKSDEDLNARSRAAPKRAARDHLLLPGQGIPRTRRYRDGRSYWLPRKRASVTDGLWPGADVRLYVQQRAVFPVIGGREDDVVARHDHRAGSDDVADRDQRWQESR